MKNIYIHFNNGEKTNIGQHVNNYPVVFGHFYRDVIFPFVIYLSENHVDKNHRTKRWELENAEDDETTYFIIKQTNHYTYDLFNKILPTFNIKIIENKPYNCEIINIQKTNYYSHNFNIENLFINYKEHELIKSCTSTLNNLLIGVKSINSKVVKKEMLYQIDQENISSLAFYRLKEYWSRIYKMKQNVKYKNVIIKRKLSDKYKVFSYRHYINIDSYIEYLKKTYENLQVISLEDIDFAHTIEILGSVENLFLGVGSEVYNLYMCQNLKNVYEFRPSVYLGSPDPHIHSNATHIENTIVQLYNVKWNIVPLKMIKYNRHNNYTAEIIFPHY